MPRAIPNIYVSDGEARYTRLIITKINGDRYVFTIDTDDLERVASLHWRAVVRTIKTTGEVFAYVQESSRRRTRPLFLHRFIANVDSLSKSVDHRDGDTFNNTRQNLREVSTQENSHNMTRAKGYCYSSTRQKWQSQIYLNQKIKHLGYFETPEEARAAYLAAKPIYHPSAPIQKENQ